MILLCREKNIVYVPFMHGSYTIRGSHNIIHMFKNYITIVFLVFNFNNNKFNSNGSNNF